MGPQSQTMPAQVVQSDQFEVKKCNHLPIIIVLVVLLICSCGFGGYELWQGLQKDSKITKLEENSVSKDNCEDDKDVVDDKESTIISLEQVRGLLKDFLVFDFTIASSNTNPLVYGLTEQYKYYISLLKMNYLDYLISDNYKIDAGYDNCSDYSFTYEDINEVYHSLFGTDSDVQDQTSNWSCAVPFFSEKDDKYISFSGCAGYVAGYSKYEILNYAVNNEYLNVDIAYISIGEKWNDDDTLQYTLSGKPMNSLTSYRSIDLFIKEHEEDLPKYRLSFKEDNSNYVLVDITELN